MIKPNSQSFLPSTESFIKGKKNKSSERWEKRLKSVSKDTWDSHLGVNKRDDRV